MTLFFQIDGLPARKQRIFHNDTVIKCKVHEKRALFNMFAVCGNILSITNEHADEGNY